jgi:hypothetical protein
MTHPREATTGAHFIPSPCRGVKAPDTLSAVIGTDPNRLSEETRQDVGRLVTA